MQVSTTEKWTYKISIKFEQSFEISMIMNILWTSNICYIPRGVCTAEYFQFISLLFLILSKTYRSKNI
jgi:hypothetical protein